jgi:cation transport regulator ChaB
VKIKLPYLLLVMNLCGLCGGCASPKATDIGAAGKERAADQNSDQTHEQMPTRSSVTADKRVATPANTPRFKPGNDVVAHRDIAPHKETPSVETPSVAPKDETTDRKPADMKVANAFDRNPYLSSVLKPLLPPRTSIMDAAAGFKNQRQFIVALHLSKNLGIPFNQIKTRMTGEHRMSLNDSLRDALPGMTKNLAKAEVNKAEQQAKDDESRAKDEAKKAAAQEKVAANGKS